MIQWLWHQKCGLALKKQSEPEPAKTAITTTGSLQTTDACTAQSCPSHTSSSASFLTRSEIKFESVTFGIDDIMNGILTHTLYKSEMSAGQNVTLCACLFETVHLKNTHRGDRWDALSWIRPPVSDSAKGVCWENLDQQSQSSYLEL